MTENATKQINVRMEEVRVSMMTMRGLVKLCQATQPVVMFLFFFILELSIAETNHKRRWILQI